MKAPIKDIFSITLRLTVTCLLAGLIMGVTFIFTSDAKKQNAYQNEERVMYALLGYSAQQAKPENLKMYALYRYIVDDGQTSFVAYLVPTLQSDFTFIQLDLQGHFVAQFPVAMAQSTAIDDQERARAILKVLGKSQDSLRFVETIRVVTQDAKRRAYILSGSTPGFKNHIKMMLALSAQFDILGVEILEHEEDPGLGAEIEQSYFRNQFVGKSLERIKSLDVLRTPIPEDYGLALNNKVGGEELDNILQKHKDDDIYALTGATISTRAVSNGVKSIVRKFVYRIEVLDKVMQSQNIQSPIMEQP